MRDVTLDDNYLERTCLLDDGRHHTNPKFDLGVLDRLPVELLSDMLVQIDLRSPTDFPRVNQRVMQVVDSIPQYQTIVKHGLAPLRGILILETGLRISCQDLFRTLRKPQCEDCDDFGGFIYVLTCSRVCFLCFSEECRCHEVFLLSRLRRLEVSQLSSNPNLLQSIVQAEATQSPFQNALQRYQDGNDTAANWAD